MKNQKRLLRGLAVALCMATMPGILSSCGSSDNIFEKAHKKTDKEKAADDIDAQDYDGAISLLQGYLTGNPTDNEAISMLSFAIAKKHKVDVTALLQSVSSGTGTAWQKLAQGLPDGTQENVDALQQGVNLLKSIPAAQRSKEQNYQLAVMSASLAITESKMVATDANGNLDPAKASTMTEAQATTIVNSVNDSSTALSSSGSTDPSNGSLTNVTGGLNNAPGTTNKDKLTNYLGGTQK